MKTKQLLDALSNLEGEKLFDESMNLSNNHFSLSTIENIREMVYNIIEVKGHARVL